MDGKICIEQKPSERFELSTPGLQDQCSNPWATKAIDLASVFFCENWNNFYIIGCRGNNVALCLNSWFPPSAETSHFECYWIFEWPEGISRRLNNDRCAVTRIRTWVIAATTQCTNHYTITAMCNLVKMNFANMKWVKNMKLINSLERHGNLQLTQMMK